MITRFEAAVKTEKAKKLRIDEFKNIHDTILEQIDGSIRIAAERGEHHVSIGFSMSVEEMNTLMDILKENGFKSWLDDEVVVKPSRRGDFFMEGMVLHIDWE